MDGVIVQVIVKPGKIQDADVDTFSEFFVGIPGSGAAHPASGHGRPKFPAYPRDNHGGVPLGRFQYPEFRQGKDPVKRR